MRIELPWPPASLSGHAKGNWHGKASVTAKHREWARLATKAAGGADLAPGDIAVTAHFIPPDNRSDRLNFAARLKPYWDGVADALGVNDKRFLPSYRFYLPDKAKAGVIIEIG